MTLAGSPINSATSSPLQGLPPSLSATNISFLSCSQEQLIEQIVSRKFIEVRLGQGGGRGRGRGRVLKTYERVGIADRQVFARPESFIFHEIGHKMKPKLKSE